MRVSVFGNPDLPFDAVASGLIPDLQKKFPDVEFIHQDPNEECAPPETAAGGGEPWIIIDAVKGVDRVTVIEDTKLIETQQRISMHDYDLGMHLTLLKKINPDLKIKIIGIPLGAHAAEILNDVIVVLAALTDAALPVHLKKV